MRHVGGRVVVDIFASGVNSFLSTIEHLISASYLTLTMLAQVHGCREVVQT